MFERLRPFRWCFVLLCVVYSLSCGGGGGGGGGGGTPAPTPTPAPNVTISSSSSSASVDSAVTISWSSTNASSCTASGAWSGSKATSGSESFTLSAADDYSFTLACSGTGGSGSASVTVSGYQTFNGVTVDGYIRLADIFIDENNNFIRDSGENNTTSDSGGKFTSLRYTSGNLVSAGGVDVDSGNLLDQLLLVNKLSEHSDLLVVTPVTSVAALMVTPDNIKAALGVDDSINIATTDPIATMADGDKYEYLYEKGSQITALVFSMQSALNEINSLTETSETYFSEFAKTLEAQYAASIETVDIETAAFIDAYVDAVLVTKATSLQDNDKTDIKKALRSLVPVISVRNNAAITTAIANFTTGKFITDFKTLAQGTASAALATSYATDINALIAADQSIQPGDLGIIISLADDSATVDEDSSVDIAVLSNDTYSTSAYGFSIATSAPSNGQVLLNADNTLSYVPYANFNGTDAFTYTVTVDDQSDTANVSVTVNPVNDAPAISGLSSSISVAENQTSVVTVSASDVDEDDLTYTLTGTDASSLSINSSGVIIFNSAPDYETKATYSVTVNVSDGTNTTTQALTITITNVNDSAPVITSLATFSVAENQTAVGTVTATDADGNTLTYTLTGTDAASLSISSSGAITFNSAPDYETKASYSVTVNVSDGINPIAQALTITITDVAETAPSFTSLPSTLLVAENQLLVHQIKAVDDQKDTINYSLSGTDSAQFNLSNSGLISLKTARDFENLSDNRFNITVTISDGSLTESRNVIVMITDVVENIIGEAQFGSAILE